MKFKKWFDMREARVVGRGNKTQNRYLQQNTDPPLYRAPVAVAAGALDSLRQSQEKSGAEFHGTPRLPGSDSESMGKGEVLDDQGITHAYLPLQVPKTMRNGKEEEIPMDPKKMRTIDNKDGDPSVDGLYIAYDEKNSLHDLNRAVEHTKELALREIIRQMTISGEINKVHPTPSLESQDHTKGILTVVFRFKPKKGGKR